jgi:hypothetical protein
MLHARRVSRHSARDGIGRYKNTALHRLTWAQQGRIPAPSSCELNGFSVTHNLAVPRGLRGNKE